MTTCFSETQRFQLCVLNIGQVKLKINGGIEREQYSAQLNFLVERNSKSSDTSTGLHSLTK